MPKHAQLTTANTFTDTQNLSGDGTAFDDIVFELTETRRGASTKPDWDTTNLGFLFPQNDATEILYITNQIPHKWKVGSAIFPHVHVVQTATPQAVFKLDYKWYSLGSGIPQTWSTYTMSSYALSYVSGTTIAQLIKGTNGIDGTGQGISSILKLKLYRSDNAYAGDILADQFDIHIEIDGYGSDEEYSK